MIEFYQVMASIFLFLGILGAPSIYKYLSENYSSDDAAWDLCEYMVVVIIASIGWPLFIPIIILVFAYFASINQISRYF